jgi:hypothetical protein
VAVGNAELQGLRPHNSRTNTLVSSYQVLTEKGKWHQLKTISSGFTVEKPESEEADVTRITDRRLRNNAVEYFTYFSDGSQHWLTTDSFIDEDGGVNLCWLEFVSPADLDRGLLAYTQNALKVSPFSYLS